VRPITDHETEQVAKANASGRAPVVFIHGLWQLESLAEHFEAAGFAALRQLSSASS
jgi:hypothetical protein